jgi:hypothetical protein
LFYAILARLVHLDVVTIITARCPMVVDPKRERTPMKNMEKPSQHASLLVRASAGLGQHVIGVFATRLIPTPLPSGPGAVFEESTSVEWQGFVVVEGALIAECEGRSLEDALNQLHSAITPSISPRQKTGTH